MQASPQIPHDAAAPSNGASTLHDLFALSDEQILEMEPEAGKPVASDEWRVASEQVAAPASLPAGSSRAVASASDQKESGAAQNHDEIQDATATEHGSRGKSHESPVTSHDVEPPAWLAAMMKDPLSGGEARELWNGIQQARQEAAAYRAAFATPEDARALKELYPGGVNEARAVAERARALETIDRAYFGGAGGTPEQTSAARAQLAATMLREDPVAFREMVFAGLRALEESEKGSAASPALNLPRLAKAFASHDTSPPHATLESPVTNQESQLAAYAAFEKAANEDLERSVGAAISRTVEQALPNLRGRDDGAGGGARTSVPLQDRLTAAVRQDVESALKADRQLGEQVAQILSARRFDNEARAQVVRLINNRARQLVPAAAKRVISDWTQSTLTTYRNKSTWSDLAPAKREAPPASGPLPASAKVNSSQAGAQQRSSPSARDFPRSENAAAPSRRVDYRKLSDEQILEL